jgi:PTS system ascorbate-specific IIA component
MQLSETLSDEEIVDKLLKAKTGDDLLAVEG